MSAAFLRRNPSPRKAGGHHARREPLAAPRPSEQEKAPAVHPACSRTLLQTRQPPALSPTGCAACGRRRRRGRSSHTRARPRRVRRALSRCRSTAAMPWWSMERGSRRRGRARGRETRPDRRRARVRRQRRRPVRSSLPRSDHPRSSLGRSWLTPRTLSCACRHPRSTRPRPAHRPARLPQPARAGRRRRRRRSPSTRTLCVSDPERDPGARRPERRREGAGPRLPRRPSSWLGRDDLARGAPLHRGHDRFY